MRRSAAARRASEAKLRGLYDAARVGIMLSDFEGRFLESNAAFYELLGYDEAELRRRGTRSLIAPQFLGEWNRQREFFIATGHFGPYECDCVHRDGRLLPVQVNGLRIRLPDGSDGIWVLVEDITERQRRRNSSTSRRASSTRAMKSMWRIVNPATA